MEESYASSFWNKSPFFNDITIIVEDEIEFTCTRLLEKLEKILATVQLEKVNINSLINSDRDNSMTNEFIKMTNELASKLDSINSLSHTHYCVNRNLKNFAEQIYSSWFQINKEGYLQHCKSRIGSRTLKGFPLIKYLKKIQIEADEIKMMLRYATCICNNYCIQRGFNICEEISRLMESISTCDYKMQLLLTIPDITPHIINLISSINDFVKENEIIPLSRRKDELDIFHLVSKLLTEELLGHESTNPEYILKTNIVKKPVFITRIIKRKKVDSKLC